MEAGAYACPWSRITVLLNKSNEPEDYLYSFELKFISQQTGHKICTMPNVQFS